MIKILLIGHGGQIGWELSRCLQPLGEVSALDYPQLDLAKPEQIQQAVRSLKPHCIINAAAYTAVDKAEEEPDLAMAVNGIAPKVLAEEAKRLGAVLIHYSTDYVFDGRKGEAYVEADSPHPLNVYGLTKLEGEIGIQFVGGHYLILRTSWVYGLRGKNFLLTMLRLARERQEIRVVADQIGAPTWCRLPAEATALILAQGIKDLSGFFSQYSGLYHLCGHGQTSWFDFAKAILALDPQKKEHLVKKIIPISTAEYPTPAERPACSILSCAAIERIFRLRLPDWEYSLQQVFG